MNKGLIANVSTTINAPSAKLWQALVTPAAIKEYMFGTTVTSDWVVGSPIVWKGEWQGRAYEDKGIILRSCPSVCSSTAISAPWRECPTSPRTTISSPWNCRPTESGPE
jgi:uncharacterized protein YndB with AHSA1/START domain